MDTLYAIIGLAALGGLYFLPWIIAGSRNHHNRGAIAVLNLLTGWTGLGWVGALAWALTDVRTPAVQA